MTVNLWDVPIETTKRLEGLGWKKNYNGLKEFAGMSYTIGRLQYSLSHYGPWPNLPGMAYFGLTLSFDYSGLDLAISFNGDGEYSGSFEKSLSFIDERIIILETYMADLKKSIVTELKRITKIIEDNQ